MELMRFHGASSLMLGTLHSSTRFRYKKVVAWTFETVVGSLHVWSHRCHGKSCNTVDHTIGFKFKNNVVYGIDYYD
jgi:hypothetical protein